MKQRCLPLSLPRTWGGARKGAGRKPASPGNRITHRTRPWHDSRLPVHVTVRVVRGLRLRDLAVAAAIGSSFRRMVSGVREAEFRIVVFSLQEDHVHLLVEASNRLALSHGMRAVTIRLAKAVNGALGRRGRVVQDRYHAHVLGSPTEARRALVYVLENGLKHGVPAHELLDGLDTRSSARWFPGWADRPPDPPPPPVSAPRTHFLRHGWKRWGLLRPGERSTRSG